MNNAEQVQQAIVECKGSIQIINLAQVRHSLQLTQVRKNFKDPRIIAVRTARLLGDNSVKQFTHVFGIPKGRFKFNSVKENLSNYQKRYDFPNLRLCLVSRSTFDEIVALTYLMKDLTTGD
jgi:hypothetical protein